MPLDTVPNSIGLDLVVGHSRHTVNLLQGLQPPMLIFVQSKERAKELFHELIYDGINVDVIHSDRTQTQVHLTTVMWTPKV